LEYDAANSQWKMASPWVRLPEAVEATNALPNANPAAGMATVSLQLDGKPVINYQTSFSFQTDGSFILEIRLR